MRRKRIPTAEPVIPQEVLNLAKAAMAAERSKRPVKCVVCGSECAPGPAPQSGEEESLCWVCRRLKLSAWRDGDSQATAQE